MVGEVGFEPTKSLTTDLQSAPFGRSGIPPYIKFTSANCGGAGGRTRTPDLLITNQLLYQLSYTGILFNRLRKKDYNRKHLSCQQEIFKNGK